jgi:hypothetical protein
LSKNKFKHWPCRDEPLSELSTPIQMCDGLDTNTSGDVETILANCNSHARRNFVELAGVNPFDYLIAIADNHAAIFEAPENWLPWNYQAALSK